jgi:hypothetical protein
LVLGLGTKVCTEMGRKKARYRPPPLDSLRPPQRQRTLTHRQSSLMASMPLGLATLTSQSPENSTEMPLDATLSSQPQHTTTIPKKKKKKKSKKPKGDPTSKPLNEDDEPSPLVLRISRNKHWRYISSYHVCLLRLIVFTHKHIMRNRAHGCSSR